MNECRFAERLAALRAEKKMTQAELAEVLSVSDKVISKWENGTSTPDFPILIKMTEIFGVTADSLLGITTDKAPTVRERLNSAFADLSRKDAVLTAFEYEKTLVPVLYNRIKNELSGSDIDSTYPITPAPSQRYRLAFEDIYHMSAGSNDANLSVTLYRNKNGFAWLKDAEKQQRIAELFAFLSDCDALSILYFIHTPDCSESFTADYIAKHTGVAVEKAKAILDESTEYDLCDKSTAHMLSGETDVYGSVGNGLLLSFVTLAYEHRCGKEAYNFNFSDSSKMAGGAKK